ncbi:MAG: bifunctional glutamate N-acetyltransferase/amino-acid acetyltransferase ArgJ [Clostridiales bacterium]|nr:bifunctional glutamate N-acetyltransferase/amino-acid acetyltransferase ArgJ [Clostridiales bacterium]
MEEELSVSYITMPKGFKANGVSAGMKCADPANINENDPKSSYLDVGMVYSDTLCNVAGVYTSNLVKGHSLVRSIDIIENKGKARGIIVNSKVANAGVGSVGVEDACKVAECASSLLGCDASEILTASTGVIGTRLPLDKITGVIPSLVESLSSSEEAAHNAEYAMMTTDTVPKEVSAQIELTDGKTVTISGMAKGSGMIHPNLATMICVFTTDCGIASASLKKMLQKAVKYTFNRVSVDGDTSVCDMVIVLANGASGVEITEGTEDYTIVEEALCGLSEDIAKMLASDGEGATKFVEIEVHGAANEKDAKLIVTSVARSPLCKTAFFGEDANIGRILTAVGYSGASFDPEKVDIRLSGLLMYKDGAAVAFDEEEASRLLAEHDIKVDITLYEGDAYDRMFTCDFSYDYVKINGSYRT